MKTVETYYENLMKRLANLKGAENRCIELGKLSGALIWRIQAQKLTKIINAIDTTQVAQIYDSSEHIHGVLIRHKAGVLL
jgi:hypothetical protein